MIAFGHTAVGVIAGTVAYNYLGQGDLITGLVTTGAVSAASHYIMDAIPHGHFFKTNQFKKYIIPVIIFDLLLPIVLILGITYSKTGLSERLLYIMFGIGGSQLPDVIDGLIRIGVIKAKGFLKVENNFHEGTHWHNKGNNGLPLGLRDIWQVLMILTALYLVIFS